MFLIIRYVRSVIIVENCCKKFKKESSTTVMIMGLLSTKLLNYLHLRDRHKTSLSV